MYAKLRIATRDILTPARLESMSKQFTGRIFMQIKNIKGTITLALVTEWEGTITPEVLETKDLQEAKEWAQRLPVFRAPA